MEIMNAMGLSERKAFQQVQREAESSGSLYDAAVSLAVNSTSERASLLASITEADKEDMYNANSVKEVTRHVTEAYVADVMRLEGLSREAAEHKAVKQRQYDRRNAFELLRKQTVGASKHSVGDRGPRKDFKRGAGGKGGPGNQGEGRKFDSGLAVAAKKKAAADQKVQ